MLEISLQEPQESGEVYWHKSHRAKMLVCYLSPASGAFVEDKLLAFADSPHRTSHPDQYSESRRDG